MELIPATQSELVTAEAAAAIAQANATATIAESSAAVTVAQNEASAAIAEAIAESAGDLVAAQIEGNESEDETEWAEIKFSELNASQAALLEKLNLLESQHLTILTSLSELKATLETTIQLSNPPVIAEKTELSNLPPSLKVEPEAIAVQESVGEENPVAKTAQEKPRRRKI
jgi:hypothetical protein